MAFESLSFRHDFALGNFPERWLPLIHLYDPDLPLFPIYYFHAVSNLLLSGQRPSETERVFGYIERISISGHNEAKISIVTNKDLSNEANAEFRVLALNEVKERLGLSNPVTRSDVSTAFSPPLDHANSVLAELWERVVTSPYGGILPFGRLWDEVLGLARFVASWNSDGRKSELIQTHYFATKFGERIMFGGSIPHMDFFLFPNVSELTNPNNPLSIFPNFSKLLDVAERFQANYCGTKAVSGVTLSKFNNPRGTGSFNAEKLDAILHGIHIPPNLRSHAIECFNAFYKGPTRTVIFLMMLSDIRSGRLKPATLSSVTLGSIYAGLKDTYQAPKVINIYAQQSFGNPNAIPKDIWVDTFFHWPLMLYPSPIATIMSHATNIGKVERLIWVTAQARKVHSSACNDAVWCIKRASDDVVRGANPLACNICLPSIRNVCPAFNAIRDKSVVFNATHSADEFRINTSAGNNTTYNQKFVSCEGVSILKEILDDFSPKDDPNGFAPYPSPSHNRTLMTVQEFIDTY